MLDVYLTVDVEVWCEDWRDLNTQLSFRLHSSAIYWVLHPGRLH